MHIPTSVAQVTSQRTISLLLQFRVDRVILITCKTHMENMMRSVSAIEPLHISIPSWQFS